MSQALTALIETFATQLTEVVEKATASRIREVLAGAFSMPAHRGPRAKVVVVATKKDGKAKVLCPVPRCRQLAAPVFGMVCKNHQHVSRVRIERFREIRRQRKLAAASASA